ncbi:MAG: putative anti sigma factor [Blastococcus sp.]|jgi:anti-anti-sigma factor|nr:putative anti sigma factor [Blastococcus sp.]
MVRAHEWDVSRRLARPPGGRRPWWVAHPASASTPLVAESEVTGSRSVIRISGDLDSVPGSQLEAYVAGRSLAGCRLLEIDLAGVPSIGSVGLSVLLGVRRWALQRGIELGIRGAQPSVWRAFEVTGLDAVFGPTAGPEFSPPAQDLSLF